VYATSHVEGLDIIFEHAFGGLYIHHPMQPFVHMYVCSLRKAILWSQDAAESRILGPQHTFLFFAIYRRRSFSSKSFCSKWCQWAGTYAWASLVAMFWFVLYVWILLLLVWLCFDLWYFGKNGDFKYSYLCRYNNHNIGFKKSPKSGKALRKKSS
jgi:hypothetical protein